MAPTTEPHSSSSDLGQRFFLLAIFAVVVAEVVVTVVNVGQWFQWSSCLLGVISALVILYLGNWLYTGSLTALKVTRVWVAIQIGLVLAALLIAWAGLPTETTLAGHLGVNMPWQGILKLVVYVGLAGLVYVPGVTLDFFRMQRGEAPAAAPVIANSEAVPTGPPAELTTEHTRALEGLNAAMMAVSGVLAIVGAVELIAGVLATAQAPLPRLLGIVEGAAIIGLGGALLAPSRTLQTLLEAMPKNMALVMSFLSAMLSTYKAYLLIAVVLIIVTVCRVMLNVM
jgi:hypothetical protein